MKNIDGLIRFSLDYEVVKIKKTVEEKTKHTVILSKIYYGFDTEIGVDILNDVWIDVDSNIGTAINNLLREKFNKYATTNNK